jgi:hypothetical protein
MDAVWIVLLPGGEDKKFMSFKPTFTYRSREFGVKYFKILLIYALKFGVVSPFFQLFLKKSKGADAWLVVSPLQKRPCPPSSVVDVITLGR